MASHEGDITRIDPHIHMIRNGFTLYWFKLNAEYSA